jgi:hypothetical protein
MFNKVVLWVLLAFSFYLSQSQELEPEISYADALASLENELDSLGIYLLLDSLISANPLYPNEINVRLGYTGSVTSAGRDFGIDQSGLIPGISYYHNSGLFGDVSGYWNSGVTPSYNPTVVTIGYLGNKKKWGYSFDYERWIYNPKDSTDNPLTNSIGSSVSYAIKDWSIGVDYSYLFGNANANRIFTNLGYTINLNGFWKFNYVSILPSFNVLIGNSEITALRITSNQITQEYRNRLRSILSVSEATEDQREVWRRRIIRAVSNERITQQQGLFLLGILNGSITLTEENLDLIRSTLDSGTYSREDFYEAESFGVLNYAFSLPLSLSANKWSLLFSYTYTIPVQLPGEIIEVDPLGYFSCSVLYRIRFK